MGWESQLELIAIVPLPNEVIVQFIAESFCSSAEMVPHSTSPHSHGLSTVIVMLEQKREIHGQQFSSRTPGVVFLCILLSRIIKKFRTSLEPHHHNFPGSRVAFLRLNISKVWQRDNA